MRGLTHIIRHLDGQHCAGTKQRQEALHLRDVIGKPLEHGIGEKNIGLRIRLKARHVADGEINMRQARPGLFDHVG